MACPLVDTNVSWSSAEPGVPDLRPRYGRRPRGPSGKLGSGPPWDGRSRPEVDPLLGPPVWSGKIDATDDGDYQTPPVKLTDAGYYTFHETLEGERVRAAQEDALR